MVSSFLVLVRLLPPKDEVIGVRAKTYYENYRRVNKQNFDCMLLNGSI